jgi:hypothetical protein
MARRYGLAYHLGLSLPVGMQPGALSSHVCSLAPSIERACPLCSLMQLSMPHMGCLAQRSTGESCSAQAAWSAYLSSQLLTRLLCACAQSHWPCRSMPAPLCSSAALSCFTALPPDRAFFLPLHS